MNFLKILWRNKTKTWLIPKVGLTVSSLFCCSFPHYGIVMMMMMVVMMVVVVMYIYRTICGWLTVKTGHMVDVHVTTRRWRHRHDVTRRRHTKRWAVSRDEVISPSFRKCAPFSLLNIGISVHRCVGLCTIEQCITSPLSLWKTKLVTRRLSFCVKSLISYRTIHDHDSRSSGPQTGQTYNFTHWVRSSLIADV